MEPILERIEGSINKSGVVRRLPLKFPYNVFSNVNKIMPDYKIVHLNNIWQPWMMQTMRRGLHSKSCLNPSKEEKNLSLRLT
jgi:hypothetical protein